MRVPSSDCPLLGYSYACPEQPRYWNCSPEPTIACSILSVPKASSSVPASALCNPDQVSERSLWTSLENKTYSWPLCQETMAKTECSPSVYGWPSGALSWQETAPDPAKNSMVTQCCFASLCRRCSYDQPHTVLPGPHAIPRRPAASRLTHCTAGRGLRCHSCLGSAPQYQASAKRTTLA